jgi:Leucine-rich repeat (LRR) protein
VDADLGLGTGDVVTGLSLYGNNLRGVLPMHELIALSNLHILDFGTNYLEGTLRSFRKLSELRTLYLNYNNITGTIPSDLVAGLAKLKTLGIGNNGLSGSIPSHLLDGVVSLEKLNIESNDLTGSIPFQFDREVMQEIRLGENALNGTIESSLFGGSTRPSAITKIDLHGNLLSGELPAVMNAPQLKILYLYENKLMGSIPETLLCQASNTLADVRLSDNAFTGVIPSLSCLMSELQLLSLSSNMLSGPIPPSFGHQLPSIREIHLYENQLTSTIPASLFQLQNLTALLLGNNQLSSSLPSDMLINAKQLELFYVNANMLTGNLNPIASSGSIKKLRLEYNQFSGALPRMNTPRLQLLYAYNNSLTGAIPTDCIWSNLQKLKLSNNSLTGGIVLGSTGALEILDLGGNSFQGQIPTELGVLQKLK